MIKTYLTFEPAPSPGKTKRWWVHSTDGATRLGAVGWRTGWRRYVWYPYANTLFDAKCLREMATFLDAATEAQRAAR